MDEFSLVAILREFGLGAALALAIFGVMFWLVRNIMKDHRVERENYQIIIKNHLGATTEGMKKLTDSIGNHDKVQQETNRYVREEHREMLRALMKINGKQI